MFLMSLKTHFKSWSAGLMGLLWIAAPQTLWAGSSTYYFVAHAGPGDPYWTIQNQGAQDAAKKLGIRVIFTSPERPGDVAKQVELLRAAISANPAGIATTIPNPRAFAAPIQLAKKKGIPLIAVNTREPKRDAQSLPYLAYIGMDELESGRQVARRALQEFGLKSGDSVVIANHEPGVMSLELRTQGIQEILKPKGVHVSSLDITANPTKAISILQSYIKANTATRAILTLGPLGYTPAGKLIENEKLQGKIHLAGFDIDPVGFALLKKGVMAFSIDAQPYVQAFQAVTQLYLASQYMATPIDLNTGVGFLDRTNCDRLSQLIERKYQ